MRTHTLNPMNVLIICLGVLLVSIRPAHAYIDPGTSSYLFQIAIASAVGALFMAKVAVRRIAEQIQRWSRNSDTKVERNE